MPLHAADAILCINMIHIAPWSATEGLFKGAARILPSNAPLYLYGPFRRQGVKTAPSNIEFEAWLKTKDPAFGLRDLEAVADCAAHAPRALPRAGRRGGARRRTRAQAVLNQSTSEPT